MTVFHDADNEVYDWVSGAPQPVVRFSASVPLMGLLVAFTYGFGIFTYLFT